MSIDALTYSSSDSLERELLRPLDVVADRLHVDAGARNRQLVVDLDGLQLDDAAAGEPGEDDVLRELRVRPRRRPNGEDAAAVEADRQIELGVAEEARGERQIEDRLPRSSSRNMRRTSAPNG